MQQTDRDTSNDETNKDACGELDGHFANRKLNELSAGELGELFDDVPSITLPRARLEGGGLPVADLLVEAGMAASRGDARRLIEGGGAYLNNDRVADPRGLVTVGDAVEGQVLLLRKGKREYHVVHLSGG